jgi:hypothetical protein
VKTACIATGSSGSCAPPVYWRNKRTLDKQPSKAKEYRETALPLMDEDRPACLISLPREIELYGGQPNKQSADMLSTYDQGRMIWHGYTGAAGWMLRQAMEGVVGSPAGEQ